MKVTQKPGISDAPIGATVTADGAIFKVWAPDAQEVHLKINADAQEWTPTPDSLLVKDSDGCWCGFVSEAKEGDPYRFYVIGIGSRGFKRDPHARELPLKDWPTCDCILRDAANYSWRSTGFAPPQFNDLIVYELHVGTFYSVDEAGADNRHVRVAKFLDAVSKIPYLRDLGVNAVELMPIVEFKTQFSLGYNGVDYFSPEMDYIVPPEEIDHYLATINQLPAVAVKPFTREELGVPINQFKALIDLFHLHGIAVLLDVVYNHAGGEFGDESMYFLDREPYGDNNNSLYFTNEGWTGGLVFAYWKREVRQFLVANAKFYLEEYRVDGFRYDEVSVIRDHGGEDFCRELTTELKPLAAKAIHVAEYWNPDRSWAVRPPQYQGGGFDAIWHDGLRESVRGAISQSAWGSAAPVNVDAIKDALYRPYDFPAAWKAVQMLESHDVIYEGRAPRVAALSDQSDPRSWYARSRSRVAMGLLMTAPGIPLIFTGQEFLEDKYWSDDPKDHPFTLTWWDGLKTDKAMQDFLQFTKELVWTRRSRSALRAENINVFHVHSDNRVIAFHRWLDGQGRDIVVVASLNESTFWNYQLGFPLAGRWFEVLNSDYYDHFPNPWVHGNGGSVFAERGPLHSMPVSTGIVIPANSVLVFARGEAD